LAANPLILNLYWHSYAYAHARATIFLSGVLYPILQLPWFLRDIAALLPLTYVVTAFRAVMILNAPLEAISNQIIVMSTFIVVVYSIAIPLFRRSVMR